MDDRIRRVEAGLLPRVAEPGLEGELLPLLERMRQYAVPGVSIAVIDRGATAWARGYGVLDTETNLPVTESSPFQAGSTSKAIASMGILRLVERGAVSLDEDVSRWLTWTLPRDEAAGAGAVTVRRLLSHHAGVNVHGFPGYAAGAAIPTFRQVLDGEAPSSTPAIRVTTPPGTLWRYSGGGTCVLQQLASEVTGQGFASLLRELVLDPLGMTASGYGPLREDRHAQAASGHLGARPIPGRFHTYPELAAAGLWTTAPDLARFVLGVQRTAAGAAGALFGAELARQTFTLQAGRYGLGLMLASEGAARRFDHGGANEGFETDTIGGVETGQGVVVMTNGGGAFGLIGEIVAAVAREYDWPDPPRYDQLTDAPVDPELLARVTGRYATADGSSITIAAADGRLHLALGAAKLSIVPTGDGALHVVSWSRRIELGEVVDGQMQQLTLGTTALRRVVAD